MKPLRKIEVRAIYPYCSTRPPQLYSSRNMMGFTVGNPSTVSTVSAAPLYPCARIALTSLMYVQCDGVKT